MASPPTDPPLPPVKLDPLAALLSYLIPGLGRKKLAKLTATILREMDRRKAKYGMVTMCVGGGQGAAGIFEAL